MIRPAAFGYNPQTAHSNAFQSETSGPVTEISENARREFDEMAAELSSKGIDVLVIDDEPEPPRPDAIFPNNWLSLHADGTVVLYPMAAENRRIERRIEIVNRLHNRFRINNLIDLSKNEDEGRFLEGTGSIVFDHDAKVAYACLSERTSADVLDSLCAALGYTPFVFRAVDRNGLEIYHTNVLLCIAQKIVIVCTKGATDDAAVLLDSLRATGRDVVEITMEQMYAFAGNMLGLGDNLLVMSRQARESLRPDQLRVIEQHCEIVSPSIETIETHGGGSVRCMIAENFLPRRD